MIIEWGPAFNFHYGLKPWELERLTWQEFDDRIAFLEAVQGRRD